MGQDLLWGDEEPEDGADREVVDGDPNDLTGEDMNRHVHAERERQRQEQ